MTAAPKTYQVQCGGFESRVWERGEGAGVPVVFLAGIGGLPAWPEFLERLSAQRRVITPSLPGFPGAENFRHLDSLYEWVLAAAELIDRTECERFDLIGSSVAGALAAELALLFPRRVRRLALIAPFGIFDPAHPTADIWAQPSAPDRLPELLCARPEAFKALWARPESATLEDWTVLRARAMEAAARYLFPLGDTGLQKRLSRIAQPALLVRGADDRVMPAAYQERFAAGLRGAVRTLNVAGAGHLVELDQPDELARRIGEFLDDRSL